jgi:hypothetical protein
MSGDWTAPAFERVEPERIAADFDDLDDADAAASGNVRAGTGPRCPDVTLKISPVAPISTMRPATGLLSVTGTGLLQTRGE